MLEIVETRPPLHRALLNYLRDVTNEMAETAIDAARCNIEHRLARWLLGKHDQLDGADLPFTHAFMARAMGVRRAGITNAVHVLEGEHLIKARRGHIVVLDRDRLEHVAVEGPQLLRRMGS